MPDEDNGIISPWEYDAESTSSESAKNSATEQIPASSSGISDSKDSSTPTEKSQSEWHTHSNSPVSSNSQTGSGFKIATAILSVAVLSIAAFSAAQLKNSNAEISDLNAARERAQAEASDLQTSNQSLKSEVGSLESEASSAEDNQNSLARENSNLRTALNGFNPCGLTGYGSATTDQFLIQIDDNSFYAGIGCEYSSNNIGIYVGAGTLKQNNTAERLKSGKWYQYYSTDGLLIVTSNAVTSSDDASQEIDEIKSQLEKESES